MALGLTMRRPVTVLRVRAELDHAHELGKRLVALAVAASNRPELVITSADRFRSVRSRETMIKEIQPFGQRIERRSVIQA